MTDDVSWMFPAHSIRALVAETALVTLVESGTGTGTKLLLLLLGLGLGQEGAIGLALGAVEVPAALVLGQAAHEGGDGEAGRAAEEVTDDGEHGVVDALAAELGEHRGERRRGGGGGPPGLAHAAGEALGRACGVEAGAGGACSPLAAGGCVCRMCGGLCFFVWKLHGEGLVYRSWDAKVQRGLL